jgi:hypothetical protein
MKIRGLDGREYHWKLQGHVPVLNDERPRSKYHKAAKVLLRELYPLDRILEEVPLPGVVAQKTLFADFYLPLRQLLIEVQGEQHYKFTPVFHGTTSGYMAALKRDQAKREWCALNHLRLVELPYNEDTATWTKRILNNE